MGIDEEKLYFQLLPCRDDFLLAAGVSECSLALGTHASLVITLRNHVVIGTALPFAFL